MRAATLLLVCVLNVSLATAAVKEDPELQVGTWVLCVSGQGGPLVCVYLHSHVYEYDCRRQGGPELQVRGGWRLREARYD